jgi:hypothetical protein
MDFSRIPSQTDTPNIPRIHCVRATDLNGLPSGLLSQLFGQADTFQNVFSGSCFLLEKGMILEGGQRRIHGDQGLSADTAGGLLFLCFCHDTKITKFSNNVATKFSNKPAKYRETFSKLLVISHEKGAFSAP